MKKLICLFGLILVAGCSDGIQKSSPPPMFIQNEFRGSELFLIPTYSGDYNQSYIAKTPTNGIWYVQTYSSGEIKTVVKAFDVK